MLRFQKRAQTQTAFERPSDMPEALYRLLTARGVASAGEARAFLNPGEDDLIDPMALSDMERARARVRRAVDSGEAICVYGDYDVDGVCASALLSMYLESLGASVRVYLPSRHQEGYGLNEHAVREIAGWARLMITVDCGVTSRELVALAASLGLDVVVTDHHQPTRGDDGAPVLPDCPVVDPLLGDYPFSALCGAGVAFKLVWALGGRDAAMPYVDIAALATVADVVSLTGENRAIVALGLRAINAAPRPGIQALVDAAALTGRRVTSTSIAFALAPRLNAGGRLGSAERSLALIRSRDVESARPLAEALEAENVRRRQVERQILDEAEKQLLGIDLLMHRAIILCGKDWNPGVIGLAASRLVERYHYPVVLLSDQGDKMTGSCRSIEGVDIYQALCGCADTMVRFGGHKQAAGLTLMSERFEAFRAAMDDWLRRNVPPQVYVPTVKYDAEADFDEITTDFIASLEGLQPTGFGNPAPVLRARAQVISAQAVGIDKAHLKLFLSDGRHRLNAIAFNEGRRAQALSETLDMLFTPKLDTYNGRMMPQLEVRALYEPELCREAVADPGREEALLCTFLTEMLYNIAHHPLQEDASALRPVDEAQLAQWLLQDPQGTLVICGDPATALRAMELAGSMAPDAFIGQLPDDPRAFNAVCVCPAGEGDLSRWHRLVLWGVPRQYLQSVVPDLPTGLETAVIGAHPAWADRLPDLDGLRSAYKGMLSLCGRPVTCKSRAQLAHLTAAAAQMDLLAAAAAVPVLEDMGLFTLNLGTREVPVTRGKVRKVAPEENALWRAVCAWRDAGAFE